MTTVVRDGDSLRFQIDPAPNETQRACQAIVQAALPPSRGNAIVLGLYALGGVAAWIFTPATFVRSAVIAIGAVAFTTMALQAEGRRRVRQLRTGDPHAQETHFVELDATGVRTWCAHIDARYPWRDFTKVAENKEFYMLVRPSGNGVAIPKRLLDEATARELRDRLREWAPDHGAALGREAA